MPQPAKSKYIVIFWKSHHFVLAKRAEKHAFFFLVLNTVSEPSLVQLIQIMHFASSMAVTHLQSQSSKRLIYQLHFL